jgi:hypothetical protein
MSINGKSRFNYATRVLKVDVTGALVEPERFDIRPTLVRTNFSDNREYIPVDGDNWSRIAWRLLGNGRYYWVIADFSGVIDPFAELEVREKTKYLTQLTNNLAAGEASSFVVDRPKAVKRGQRLRLQDLDPSNPVSVDVSVLAVNETTGLVSASPFTVPVGGIPAALSKVSLLYPLRKRLTCPTPARAQLEALDFDNPLNILVV